MLAVPTSSIPPSTSPSQQPADDPFVQYARSLHDYTLRLWTESRRIAEEKARMKAAATGSAARTLGDSGKSQPIPKKRPEAEAVKA